MANPGSRPTRAIQWCRCERIPSRALLVVVYNLDDSPALDKAAGIKEAPVVYDIVSDPPGLRRFPSPIQLVEVSPRDGLQDEASPVSTDLKTRLIALAVEAGLRRIETVAFVDPKRVPQMADAEAVMAAIPRPGHVSYIGLVLNRRGFDRAANADVDEINYVLIATDTFSVRNQGATTAQSLDRWAEIATLAHGAKIKPTLTIGAAFGCPFEGEVRIERIRELIVRASDYAPAEIALADTIGVAVPTQVIQLVSIAREAAPGVSLRCHLHNTRNTGYANAMAALQSGVTALDTSIGGIGGCPFAPRATGNIATEDLLYALDRMAVSTGVRLELAIAAAEWIGRELGRELPALLGRAGPFPTARRVPDSPRLA